MTLTRRERFLIFFGLITVSIVAYVFYFLIPYMNNTTDTKTRLSKAQQELNVQNMKAASIKTMKDDIAKLEGQLKENGDTIPTGLDHAKILLYLTDLAKGKATDLSVTITNDQSVQNQLLAQPVTAEFNTTWQNLRKILDSLKQNKLYNRVVFMQTDYQPGQQADAQPAATEGATPAATPPATDKNVLKVHLELVFFAFQPAEGQLPEQPLTPAAKDRANSLFPLE